MNLKEEYMKNASNINLKGMLAIVFLFFLAYGPLLACCPTSNTNTVQEPGITLETSGDPMGEAHFERRPLDMSGGFLIFLLSESNIYYTHIGDFFNVGLYHEHLFFDDGSGENMGFLKVMTKKGPIV